VIVSQLRFYCRLFDSSTTSAIGKLLSGGVVEGLNKAKAAIRKSYRFRTFRCLELALYHSLAKLPEPNSTHDFF
jgi:hypothetical protein